MASFSPRSLNKLSSCDPRLKELFMDVVKVYDCTVLEGHRSEERQDELYRTGFSRVQYPNSRHNLNPSFGVDVAPYPIDWNDRERFVAFGSFVRGIAHAKKLSIRWGGDWDMDGDTTDQTFNDLCHWELYGEKYKPTWDHIYNEEA